MLSFLERVQRNAVIRFRDQTTNTIGMPKKIRELIQKLENIGFVNRGGKGSHRNFKHPQGIHILLSGKPGNDAKPYQERQVSIAIEKVKK